MRYVIALLICTLFSAPAWARHHHHHWRHHYAHHHHRLIRDDSDVAVNDTGRPRDCFGIPWCGCWLRHHLGINDRDYNRAIEWEHYGHASSPHVGAVVVWPHHVGIITGGHPGDWIITSGNDGHAVRSRRRSLARVVAVRA